MMKLVMVFKDDDMLSISIPFNASSISAAKKQFMEALLNAYDNKEDFFELYNHDFYTWEYIGTNGRIRPDEVLPQIYTMKDWFAAHCYVN
jgi:hypothetical protein